MQWIESESKVGYYYTFVNGDGEKIVALGGLDPTQIHTPYGIELFMLNHFDSFAAFYWLLLLATFVYLAGTFIVIPLYFRWKRGLPLFEEQ